MPSRSCRVPAPLRGDEPILGARDHDRRSVRPRRQRVLAPQRARVLRSQLREAPRGIGRIARVVHRGSRRPDVEPADGAVVRADEGGRHPRRLHRRTLVPRLPAEQGHHAADEDHGSHGPACRDDGDRHRAERMRDEHDVIGSGERRVDHVGVGVERRRPVLDRQVDRDGAMTARFDLGDEALPTPGAVPGAVNEDERQGFHGGSR